MPRVVEGLRLVLRTTARHYVGSATEYSYFSLTLTKCSYHIILEISVLALFLDFHVCTLSPLCSLKTSLCGEEEIFVNFVQKNTRQGQCCNTRVEITTTIWLNKLTVI